STIPRPSSVERKACAPNAPSATARKQRIPAMRNNKIDILLFPATSPRLQLLFQIAEGQFSASASRSDVENCSSRSDCRCSKKIQCRSEFPQVRAEDRTGADDQITNKIVATHHLAAFGRIGICDDERLARWIAEFFQATNQKCDDQSRKTPRHQQADRKKREHDEGHYHEWLAAILIRVMRGRNYT